MKQLSIYLVLATLLLGGTIAYGELSANSPSRESAESFAAKRALPLRIRGHVTGLYPGINRRMIVRIRNTSARRVVISSLRTMVGDASPSCRGTNLQVAKIKRRVEIRPSSRRRLRVPVRMSPNAAAGCESARFPLRFRARWRRR